MNGPHRRVPLRSVAMPVEHGGWGLTLEPGILGVLAAPSLAGLLLGAAALVLFLVRTPLRLVLIGRRHHDRPRSTLSLERSQLAARVSVVELTTAGTAVVLAALLAQDPLWWLPALIAAPLFALALWFDMRSRSRHLVPEIVGSVAIGSVASMGALAGGAAWSMALGLWVILAARIFSSIPHVRAQIRRIHGRPVPPLPGMAGDIAALTAAVGAVLMDPSLVLGALAIAGLVIVQRITLARPPRPAKILGVRQMVLGLAVVGATALGTWLL
jgi:hypothetical protein